MSLSANWESNDRAPYLCFEAGIRRIKEEWETLEATGEPEAPAAQGWSAVDWAHDMLGRRGVTKEIWMAAVFERRRRVLNLVAVQLKPNILAGSFPSVELVRAELGAGMILLQEESWLHGKVLAMTTQVARQQLASLNREPFPESDQTRKEAWEGLQRQSSDLAFVQWLFSARVVISMWWNKAKVTEGRAIWVVMAIWRACSTLLRLALQRKQGKAQILPFMMLCYLPTLAELQTLADDLVLELPRTPLELQVTDISPFVPRLRTPPTSARIPLTPLQDQVCKYKNSLESIYRLHFPKMVAETAHARLERLWISLSNEDQERTASAYLHSLVSTRQTHRLPRAEDLLDDARQLDGWLGPRRA